MGDTYLRRHNERMAIMEEIAAGIMGKPETLHGDWPDIDPSGTPHERCAVTRSVSGRRRCLDARCDRCWPNFRHDFVDVIDSRTKLRMRQRRCLLCGRWETPTSSSTQCAGRTPDAA